MPCGARRRAFLGNVDPDDGSSRLRPAPGRDRLRARAAADIQHAVPGADICKVEQVLSGSSIQRLYLATGKGKGILIFGS